VYPQNNSAIVNRLGELLGVDLDTVFALKAVEGTLITVIHY
jgi:hypothetical protein